MSAIIFSKPDSPEAAAMLRAMVERINLPVLALLVKVNERDEVVNVELTDEHTVKSLALVAALAEE